MALRAQARVLKQTTGESLSQDIVAVADGFDPALGAEQRELRIVIDDEVNRLPEKYRLPIVLCYFEGRSNGEAARELGCPVGTVESRLTRARERLRRRLLRRGFAPSVGVLAGVLAESVTSASVPTALVMSTATGAARIATGQAAGAISTTVAALTEGVLKAMWMTKLRIISVVVAVTLLGSTHLAWGGKPLGVDNQNPASPQPATNKAKAPVPPAAEAIADDWQAAPGYGWAIAPREGGRGFGAWSVGWRPPPQPGLPAESGISAIEERDKDGGLVITMAHPPRSNAAHLPDYRPVAFDAARRRYPLKMDYGVSTQTAALERYSLDPKVLPAALVTHLGVEVLTPGGPKVIAKQAAKQVRKAGVEVLSFPEIGATYDFVLTATDGKKIQARDWRGKVVLIDCWAKWNPDSMALLADIKELYEQWHLAGLEVIGINLDGDAEKATKICRLLGLAWPQVVVPNDQTTRQLWQEASGIGGLPRIFVIDREGILRFDSVHQLDQKIAKMMKMASEKSE